jgi:hypothetical protein
MLKRELQGGFGIWKVKLAMENRKYPSEVKHLYQHLGEFVRLIFAFQGRRSSQPWCWTKRRGVREEYERKGLEETKFGCICLRNSTSFPVYEPQILAYDSQDAPLVPPQVFSVTTKQLALHRTPNCFTYIHSTLLKTELKY